MAPEVISGRYRVRTAVGHGGMGTVWLCTDEVLGRDVAVKQVGLLPGESATDSARALREARSTATLNHKNVVAVFDIVEEDGSLWMVMEHVPSRTLAQLTRDEGPLSPERVADVGAQVAAGLAAAHAAGVIHRDVKPANVLVGEDGVAKIGDFGIARSLGDEPLTQAGLVTGTPSYFSPELAEGHDPGPESDVWALGATLYTAVEGTPPYPAQDNPVAMLRTIASQPPARPRRAGFLEPALTRMLDRDPASRWSMPDAAHTLRRLADRHGAQATRRDTAAFAAPVAPVPPARVPDPAAARQDDRLGPALPRGGRRRLRVLALVTAAVVILAAAGLAYALAGHDGTPAAGGRPAAPATHRSPTPSPTQPSASASSTPSPGPATGKDASVRFLRDYYATVPGNLDAGWSRLGPHERQVGRSSYDAFWQRIDRVDLTDVTPHPDASTAEVTLTYHFSDGRVVKERQRLVLVRSSGGGYLIDDDKVLSSRTVSG